MQAIRRVEVRGEVRDITYLLGGGDLSGHCVGVQRQLIKQEMLTARPTTRIIVKDRGLERGRSGRWEGGRIN